MDMEEEDAAVVHRVVIDNSNEHCRVMEFLLRTPIIDSIIVNKIPPLLTK